MLILTYTHGFTISVVSTSTLALIAAKGVNAGSINVTSFLVFTLVDICAATHQLTVLQFRKNLM